jgi:Fur family zinc uptake transcriptional regulator
MPRRPDTHDHRHCVRDALRMAEEICAADGGRLTAVRRRVLELVWQSHKPAKTYDLLAMLEKESSAAKPPTVYRALDFLAQHGLVHKLESVRAYVGCSHPADAHTCYFLICDACGQVEECCDEAIVGAVAARAKKAGFAIARQQLEAHGTCRACA